MATKENNKTQILKNIKFMIASIHSNTESWKIPVNGQIQK